MQEGLLFVVSGPSGAGKGTICKGLVERFDIDLSVSMTTRKPRESETEGKSYYFITEDRFNQILKKGGFLEHACVYGNLYGTPKDLVLQSLQKGKDVVLEIDIQGAMQIRQTYPKAVFIFILPPSMSELRKRITGRGSETEHDINIRLNETLKEVSYIDKYDYCVVNGKLDEALDRVAAIIKAEHSKVSENVFQLIQKYKDEIRN